LFARLKGNIGDGFERKKNGQLKEIEEIEKEAFWVCFSS